MLPDLRDIGGSTTAGFGSLMLINRAPHPNAAKVFINWLLGKEGQTAFSKASGYPSRRMDAPTDHLPDYGLPKPGVKYWHGYLDKYVMRPPEELGVLKEIFGR
jgi:iron(III) transport system substrate-binding protein